MKLAFYAPMKPPDDPVPSGDRTMARALIAALEHGGAEVTLASRLRSRDGKGNAETQAGLMDHAQAALPDVIASGRDAGWHAWITYHNYYKAPDLLGPKAADALNIPYVQIEATRARKRLNGPWARFAQAAEDASDAANVIFYLTHRDAKALQRDAPKDQHLIHLPPFLNIQTLPQQGIGHGPVVAVGMMRDGDKLASYQIIAQTLARLRDIVWQLHIVGDGPARGAVEKLMAPFGDRAAFLGELDSATLSTVYQNTSLLFWPGVNEAFGLAYLEAQAAGLPVLAQHRPGVCDVLAPGTYPSVKEGADALAKRLTEMLASPAETQAAGMAARAYVEQHHLLPAAAKTLRAGLTASGVTP